MPPLKHSLPGKEYDVTNSQAVDWLIHQPEIMQLVFDSVRDHGDIVFCNTSPHKRGVSLMQSAHRGHKAYAVSLPAMQIQTVAQLTDSSYYFHV